MVLWIFRMELKQWKDLKGFFCGTVPLFAHFISCYRGMSLTSFDFFMCLGSYINRIPGDFTCWHRSPSDKLLHSCVRLRRKVDYRSCGQPADRAFSPLLSFLFYSLLILLYLFISQTRQNQQHFNTTNASPGGWCNCKNAPLSIRHWRTGSTRLVSEHEFARFTGNVFCR